MFPVPKALVSERIISEEPDLSYRALLSQELRYCIKNQDTILRLAQRTYKRVLLGKNPGLVVNSCSFSFLEEKCREYMVLLETLSVPKPPLDAQIATAGGKMLGCVSHFVSSISSQKGSDKER